MQDILTNLWDNFTGWITLSIRESIIFVLNNISTLVNSFDYGSILDSFGNPVYFDSSATSGQGVTMWNTVETISNNIIVPIAGFVLMVVVIFELYQMILEGNNFRDFDTSIFIKWILKTFCGIILISNVFYITTGIFVIGSDVTSSGFNLIFNGNSTLSIGDTSSIINSADFLSALESYGFFTLLFVLILTWLTWGIYILAEVCVIIVFASRFIEIFLYMSISPIPMATFMARGWNDIGNNWLRNVLALAFQGFLIVVILGLYKNLFANSLTALMSENSTSVLISIGCLAGFGLALIFTIFKSSSISKSMFSAH